MAKDPLDLAQQAEQTTSDLSEGMRPGMHRSAIALTANDWTYENPNDLYPPTEAFNDAIEREWSSTGPEETLVILVAETHSSSLDRLRCIPELNHLARKRDEAFGKRNFLFAIEDDADKRHRLAAQFLAESVLPEQLQDPNGHLYLKMGLVKAPTIAAPKALKEVYRTILALNVPVVLCDALIGKQGDIQMSDPLLPRAVEKMRTLGLSINDRDRLYLDAEGPTGVALRNAIMVERSLKEARARGIRIIFQVVGFKHMFGSEPEGLLYSHSIAKLYSQIPGVRIIARFRDNTAFRAVESVDPQAWKDLPNVFIDRRLNNEMFRIWSPADLIEEGKCIKKLDRAFSGPSPLLGLKQPFFSEEDIKGMLRELKILEQQQQQGGLFPTTVEEPLTSLRGGSPVRPTLGVTVSGHKKARPRNP